MNHAARGGSAARVGGFAAIPFWVGLAALACAPAPSIDRRISVETAPQPEGSTETVCAWYGDARDGVLYFGESAFWAALRAHGGNPLADAKAPGPRRIGRFDLAGGRLLSPLAAGPALAPSGVWDVLAHPNGRVYFTTWFEAMGWVDPSTGEVVTFPELGTGLNELAIGPNGSILASRYGGDSAVNGSVLALGANGERIAEYALAPPAGYRVAPKTVAFDSARGEIWVTTDLLGSPGAPIRHDAFVLDASGRLLRRIEQPELQFAAFRPEGGGVLAEVEGSRLWLRLRPASGADRVVLADDRFANGLDFVQDVHFAADGRAVATRWSGTVHVVDREGSLRTLQLPRLEPDGLYYSGTLAGERLCATYCAGITIVCAPVAAASR